jgi:hypothetical protein
VIYPPKIFTGGFLEKELIRKTGEGHEEYASGWQAITKQSYNQAHLK